MECECVQRYQKGREGREGGREGESEGGMKGGRKGGWEGGRVVVSSRLQNNCILVGFLHEYSNS